MADNLTATNAKIGKLTAETAYIGTLTADLANIETLLAGSAGVGNLQAIHLTGKNAVIDDAVITDAMIASLAADKIQSGAIYTELVSVQSGTGRLVLSGETLQIGDGARIRVQIGRDAAGDYNLALWDVEGRLLWDAAGVYAAGLHDGIIRDIAVAADADISGSKLNIASVASRLSEDGSLVLDSSRITLDGTTLDVAYQTLIQADSELGERTTELATGLSVVQGQIQSKVWQSDVTAVTGPMGEQITALEDRYSQITQAVDGIRLSVGDLQTTVSGQASSISNITGKLELYVERTDKDQIVSMLNASADVIRLSSNRITIDSTNFGLAEDGTITATAGLIGGFALSAHSLSANGLTISAGQDELAPEIAIGRGNDVWRIQPYFYETSSGIGYVLLDFASSSGGTGQTFASVRFGKDGLSLISDVAVQVTGALLRDGHEVLDAGNYEDYTAGKLGQGVYRASNPSNGAVAAGESVTLAVATNACFLVVMWSHAAAAYQSAALVNTYSGTGHVTGLALDSHHSITQENDRMILTGTTYRWNYTVCKL